MNARKKRAKVLPQARKALRVQKGRKPSSARAAVNGAKFTNGSSAGSTSRTDYLNESHKRYLKAATASVSSQRKMSLAEAMNQYQQIKLESSRNSQPAPKDVKSI